MKPAVLEDLIEATRAISASSVRLVPSQHENPNRKDEKRLTKVLTGELDLPALSEELPTLLALASRRHLGRHANEGLGRFELVPVRFHPRH